MSSDVVHGSTQDIADQLHTLSALADAHEQLAKSSLREISQLRTAIQTRDVIGQAKGILMERYDIGSTAAFQLLREMSQDSNVRVVTVAETLVDLDHPDH